MQRILRLLAVAAVVTGGVTFLAAGRPVQTPKSDMEMQVPYGKLLFILKGEKPGEIIYADGTRLPSDCPDVMQYKSPKDLQVTGYKGLPAVQPADFPVVVFHNGSQVVSVRRSRDGSFVE